MALQGHFTWYELMTTDAKAAADFYGAVIGWKPTKASNTTADGMEYTVFNIPGFDMGVAGMMTLTADMKAGGARPCWMGYVGADDVDAKTKEFAANGGKVHVQPCDIPGIGRFSVVADPHGAMIYLFKPNMPEGPMPEMPKPGTPGTVGWNELYAGNAEEAFAFYSKMFGWTKSMAVDMGAMGVYQCFALDGRDLGGMMKKADSMPMPLWNYYWTVPKLDPAIETLTAKGGKVINGPHPVPGGAWIVQALDPQGAMFSLTAAER